MLGTPCMRKLYYSTAKVPEDYAFPLDGKRRTVLGDAIGDLLYETFKKAGIAIDYIDPETGEIPINKHTGKPDPEFQLKCPELLVKKGKIDLVCVIEGELWLGEFKSINDRGFYNLNGRPKEDHLIQGITYFYIFNMLLKQGKFKHIKALDGFERAKGIKFLYYNKDKSKQIEFPVTEADEYFKHIVHKIQNVKYFIDNDILPPKTEHYCKSCSWRKKCSQNQKI